MLSARLAEFRTAFAVALGVYPTLLKTKDPSTTGLMFAVFAEPAKYKGFADTEPQAITTAAIINKDLRIILSPPGIARTHRVTISKQAVKQLERTPFRILNVLYHYNSGSLCNPQSLPFRKKGKSGRGVGKDRSPKGTFSDGRN